MILSEYQLWQAELKRGPRKPILASIGAFIRRTIWREGSRERAAA